MAGLANLIPIPGVDWFFEDYFRRQIPLTLAERQHKTLDRHVVGILNKPSSAGCLNSCLGLPIKLVVELIKRISRKIVYFLTIKEATDKISLYWQQAFLMNYMLAIGHLETVESALLAKEAMAKTIETTNTSPIIQLAQETIAGTKHIFRSLRRARGGTEDELIQEKKSYLAQQWSEFEEYFQSLAEQYTQTYKTLQQSPSDDIPPQIPTLES
jgi:hypothetical protein